MNYSGAAGPLGTSSLLLFNNLVRNAGATLNLANSNANLDTLANRIAFTTVPTAYLTGSNGGILPFVTVANNDFATYDLVNNSLGAFTGYVNSLAAAGPNDTVKLAGPDMLTGNKTINALLLTSGSSVGEEGYTLTLASGGLLATNNATVVGGTLNFDGKEGIVIATAGTATINSILTGTVGLTVGGGATVVLPNANPGLSGGSTLAGGTLQLGNATALGTSTVTLISGTLQSLAGITLANPVVLNNSTLTISGSNNLTFAGSITLSDTGMAAGTFTNTLTVSNTAQTVFSAHQRCRTTVLAGTGNVFLTGNNTYTGNTFLTGNLIVVAGSNTAFGTGTLVLTTGTLLAGSAGTTLANNFVLNGQGFIFGASSYNGASSGSTTNSSLTFNGAGALDYLANYIVTAVYNTTTFGGTVSGPGGLLVVGPGNLVLAGSNTYYGGTVFNSSGTGLVSSQYATSSVSTVTGMELYHHDPDLHAY